MGVSQLPSFPRLLVAFGCSALIVGLRRCIRLYLFRVGAPAQRYLFVFGNLIAAVVPLDARLAAEVEVVHRHPLLVAHMTALCRSALQVLQQ